jgi:hypothetical protein
VLITYSDAAALLGLRSRNSLYRKINSGELEKVITPDGPRLESEGLVERWGRITRTAADSPKPPPRPIENRSQHPVPRPRQTEEIPDYNDSRARSEFEKANLLELERKAKEGLLIPRDQVERAAANVATIVRTKLLAVPTRARQRIPHLTLEEVAILEELQREALEELADGR